MFVQIIPELLETADKIISGWYKHRVPEVFHILQPIQVLGEICFKHPDSGFQVNHYLVVMHKGKRSAANSIWGQDFIDSGKATWRSTEPGLSLLEVFRKHKQDKLYWLPTKLTLPISSNKDAKSILDKFV